MEILVAAGMVEMVAGAGVNIRIIHKKRRRAAAQAGQNGMDGKIRFIPDIEVGNPGTAPGPAGVIDIIVIGNSGIREGPEFLMVAGQFGPKAEVGSIPDPEGMVLSITADIVAVEINRTPCSKSGEKIEISRPGKRRKEGLSQAYSLSLFASQLKMKRMKSRA